MGYTAVFRTKLDSNGEPVPYEKFRKYACEVVDGLDRDPEAQEMILEQFVAEAQSGRAAFDVPALMNESDLQFRPITPRASTFSESRRVLETPQDSSMKEYLFDMPNWRRIVEVPSDAQYL